MKKNWIYIVLLLVVVVFATVKPLREFITSQFSMTATVDKATAESSFTEEDFDVDLKGINVPDANLKDFKGKVVFLNFWGTWCAPCRTEWPSIEKLYGLKKDNMAFALIAMQDKEEDVIAFIKENNYTAPVYIAKSPISPNMLPNVFPTTYIVGKELRIYKKEENLADWSDDDNMSFINSVTK